MRLKRKKHSLNKPKIVSVTRIWDYAPHNALTDLFLYEKRFFCCFREADQHAAGENGKIRIIASDDARHWSSVALLSMPGVDLRDPQLSQMPDGRLMLLMGGSRYQEGKYLGCSPHVAFSSDCVHWSSITDSGLKNEWIWRVIWHQGMGYGVSYRLSDPSDINKPWISTLFSTTDGLNYSPVTQLDVTKNPSEAALRIAPDNTMVALMRSQGDGWIGFSKPPYTKWQWNTTRQRLGGPNFLILPDGQMWACTRLFIRESGKSEPKTALGHILPDRFTPTLFFPSGGDNSYPGMVFHNNTLYVSYYSSHEGKTMIYLAQIVSE